MNTLQINSHAKVAGSRRRRSRIVALGISCALGLGLLGAPAASAADSPAGLGPLVPSGPRPARTVEQQALLDALASARSTGKAVVVDAMTTELSKTVANPDGTLTTTDNAQAVRTRRTGGWADIDSTLRSNADGSLSPVVASTDLTFSGGGTGPMATVTTGDGKKLAISAPFPLPRPTTAGPTATYSDVLPGVDLQLTALPVGGWRDVLVVRTLEAAESQALRSLRFPFTADGLTVATDSAGGIDVRDEKGVTRFRSPAPLQWDSSRKTEEARASRTAGRNLLAAASPDEAPVVTGSPSTAEEPGDGANVAAISTSITGNAIELTPDQEALGSGTGPWYLDPSLTAATSYVQGSVEVQENYKSAENYNKKSNLATGYCGYHSSDPSLDCGSEGRQRAYFQFGINPAVYTVVNGAEKPPTIFGATLHVQVTGASSPSTNTPLVVYWAPSGIHEHTSWNNQPCGTSGNVVMEGCAPVNGQWITGTGPLAIDVTDKMKQAAAGHWPTWTIAIAPQASEWEKLYRHHIANNPSIVTTYDITPTVWDPRTSPTPGFAHDNSTARCTSGGASPADNPGWVGSNQNIHLTANSWSPTGQVLYTGYEMWDDNDPNFWFTGGGWGGSYNDPGFTVPVGSLSDGHQYHWVARATDDILTSPSSAMCYFRVDRTNPRISLQSADFPPAGTPNGTPPKYVNEWGTFTVQAEDPAPGGGLHASGIACVRITPDPTPVVGWRCGDPGTYSPSIAFGYKPANWGTNILYAWAMDKAGNYSQPAAYNFYAPWKPGTQPLFGDVTNDQKPDIVFADKQGALRVIGGASDPHTALAASPASAPRAREYGTTWADFRVSHHGTLAVGDGVDQIVAHYAKGTVPGLSEKLYLIPNSNGQFDALTLNELLRPAGCTTFGTASSCPAYKANWGDISQVVAIGTPEGQAVGPAVSDPSRKIMMSKTSLLTLENNNLYLFQPNGADTFSPAVLIPSTNGSWNDYEILNPGAANGETTRPAALGVPSANTNQTTVWARHRTTGEIFAYPLTWKVDGSGAAVVDYTALTKPAAGVKLPTPRTLTTADYPRIGAGDVNNDGLADLWTIDNNNAIAVFPGVGAAAKVDGFEAQRVTGYADASVSIRSNAAGGICTDADGGARDGAELVVNACGQAASQRFNFSTDGTVRAAGYCVSTKDNALANGTRVVLALCAEKTGQKWVLRPDGRLHLPATVDAGTSPSGRCLELPGGVTAQGTRLAIQDCPGLQANQQWNLWLERIP